MEEVAIIPESISKNIFETYYRLIENFRNSINTHSDFLKSLNALELVITALERSVQDRTSSDRDDLEASKKIVQAIIENLSYWVLTLASLQDDDVLSLKAFIYNVLPLITVSETYDDDYVNALRHISKIDSPLKTNNEYERNLSTLFYKQLESLAKLNVVSYLETDQIMHAVSRFSGTESFDYRNIDPFHLTKALKDSFSTVTHEIDTRYLENYFRINDFEKFLDYSEVEDLRKEMRNINLFERLEHLFFFNDEIDNAIWQVAVKIDDDNNQYDSAEIGYLMWTFSKALESIDDVYVGLDYWGEGSKWFNLKVRIQSLASKVDIMQILKLTRQSIESILYKKPLDEILKTEAEKNKLIAETEKVELENNNIIDEEKTAILTNLNIQDKLLDIQQKELDIENRKADIRLKNIQVIRQLSEVMSEGIIQNNSSIQILINNGLFLDYSKGKANFGNTELLDIGEIIRGKNEDDPNNTNIDISNQII